jgi:hypothetical protein
MRGKIMEKDGREKTMNEIFMQENTKILPGN